jgi:hypothetical protein
MWWDQYVQVQHIDENKVTWREFKQYFEKKYLTKRYYDKKMKEFFELKFESTTIDEYERIFLELLKYVPFIKDEQVKIQRYLSGLPLFISDKIQYGDPKTLEETIRRAKCLYDQQRGRSNFHKAWEEKMKRKVEQRKKRTKPPFFRNIAQGQPISKKPTMTETMETKPRQKLVKCLGCDRNHMFIDFLQRGEKTSIVYSVQQDMIVEDMGINVPRIYAVVDNKQVEFQLHMIEVEDKINDQPIVILIESRASHSYLYPNMVERFQLPISKFGKPWLVQLATLAKRKINEMIQACPMRMNGLHTKDDLNIIPLGSYDCLISMDSLDQHHAIIDYYNKTFTCLYD